MKRTTLLSAATPLAVAAAAILAVGDLNPPAGAVAATGKRLTEIEPRIALNATNTPGLFDCVFLIAEPGSYYLTGNLQGVSGKHGIKVVSSNVKIDLNGFDVVGAAGMGPYDGILASGNPIENINVRNGTVRGWGDEGLDLAAAQYSRVDDLTANGNVGDGIVTGPLSIVRSCSANANSGAGIPPSHTLVPERYCQRMVALDSVGNYIPLTTPWVPIRLPATLVEFEDVGLVAQLYEILDVRARYEVQFQHPDAANALQALRKTLPAIPPQR